MQEFELVVGLEVHIQLSTSSKLFCSDSTKFGQSPNTQVSVISLAHPGTLPMLNRQAVQMAIKLGLALQSKIADISFFDRKHYFYPDLPKAYQTTQHTKPILVGGELPIGNSKLISIHHIHLEEDAGKSIHDLSEEYSYIDLNRAGMPLLELVTDPAIHSSADAGSFLTELRRLVRWIGICDGNLEEGSMRCDANISIRPKGESKLGTKVEVKNLNSIRNIKRAIEAEMQRQIEATQNGIAILQQTRSYNANTNTTKALREKENAHDYRYFPCPDLPPFTISASQIEGIASQMPQLPFALETNLIQQFGLSAQEASILTEENNIAQYFLSLSKTGITPKAAANWLLGPVKSWLNENNKEFGDWPISVEKLASAIDLVQTGKINFSMAAGKLLPAIIENQAANVQDLTEALGLWQANDTDQLQIWIDTVLSKMPEKVAEYKNGKKGLIGLFVGEVKKISKGKADMQMATKILSEKLG